MRGAALLALAAALAACTPVENDHPPPVAVVGTGTVTAMRSLTEQTGETRADRFGKGFMNGGGLAGALAAAAVDEDHLGEASLHEYDLKLAGGTTLTAPSFSLVAVGDCVKASKIGDKSDFVLERLDPAACAAAVR